MKKKKLLKKVIALLLCMMLIVPSVTLRAADVRTDVSSENVVNEKTETEESKNDVSDMTEQQDKGNQDQQQETTKSEDNPDQEEVSQDSVKEEEIPQDIQKPKDTSQDVITEKEVQPKEGVSVEYRSHIQNVDWETSWKKDGQTSGTTGSSKRLEAIRIRLKNQTCAGSVEYRTHIQDYGWETSWKKDGQSSGTSKQAKRLEAIQIRLTGQMAEQYDIYYRVHAQNFGWLGWTKNGDKAGTEGYALRLEAIEMKLLPKGSAAPGTTENPFVKSHVKYRAHSADIGWQPYVYEGQIAGTTGKNRPVQAMNISLDKPEYNGNIEYRAYVQDNGWQNWVKNGAMTGTTGKNLKTEAMEIRLTGEMANHYDLYYRLHVANYGWLGWAKNGETAGTSGRDCGIEAVEIRFVTKGGQAPGNTNDHYIASAWETDYVQNGETTVVSVKPESIGEIQSKNLATSVEVTATMEYKGKVTRQIKAEKSVKSVAESGFLMDLKTYGKFKVTAAYKKNGKVVGKDEGTAAVAASEYNLAPLSATFPVVYFSLSMWDITTSADTGKAVPTIVMLDRPAAYNWNNLPKNVYAMPYLTEKAIQTSSDYHAYAQYVKDLYEISPNAKFHLYINDITCSYIHWVIYANRIPEGQYTITMLSDGSGTYGIMNETYNVPNPQEKHQQLIEIWNAGKKQAYETGTYGSDWGWHSHWDCMYAVLSCEPGTQWWVSRNDLFTSGDNNVFAEQIKNSVKAVNVNTLLQALTAKGEQVTEEFKNLYNFNDGYFSDAEEQGKKAMLLLGTYVFNEENFSDYARLTQLYYGDDYLYYYKGHPRTPTDLYPEKKKQLQDLGIQDVDSATPAELILFFNPEINMSGYGSSTFNSASEEMACGLFSTTKDQALNGGSGINYSGIDWFASLIDLKTADPEIAKLCKEGNTNYLLEFSDEIEAKGKHDIAIFDASDGILKFYKKQSDGSYEMVEKKSEGNRITYSSHVKDYGWLAKVKENTISGTVGESRPMEAFRVDLGNTEYDGSVEYRAHVADIGWQEWVTEGKDAGTVGKSKPIEAVSIRLTGEIAKHYDIYYQLHVKNFGWLDWAKNGENAGTQGYAYPAEAIRITLVEKGQKAPGSTKEPFKKTKIQYQGHVSQIGWQSWQKDGASAGTTGKNLGMEALRMNLLAPEYAGGVKYRAHVQNIGWQGWKENGALAGTTGKSLHMEAVQIELTGKMAEKYDIYYRVHSQSYGWLGWAKNGAAAGTSGLNRQMEAVEIRVVQKGEKAPGSTEKPYIKFSKTL